MNANDEIVIHVAQDMQDLFYQTTIALAREFRNRLREERDDDAAWQWFIEQVDYDNDGSKPIKHGTVLANHGLEVLFLDWDQLADCLDEWTELDE